MPKHTPTITFRAWLGGMCKDAAPPLPLSAKPLPKLLEMSWGCRPASCMKGPALSRGSLAFARARSLCCSACPHAHITTDLTIPAVGCALPRTILEIQDSCLSQTVKAKLNTHITDPRPLQIHSHARRTETDIFSSK